MKKFASINKRSSQLFISKRAQTFLKLASIYDEFGDFEMAEYVQSEAIKYSKFIRIAEDLSEEEDDYLSQEADVKEDAENLPIGNAKQYFQSIAHPEFNDTITNYISDEVAIGQDHFYINPKLFGLTGRSNTYMERHGDLASSVKFIIKQLSIGGRNIYNSLKSLSDFLNTDSNDFETNQIKTTLLSDNSFFNKVLGTALATYYNCPSFLFSNYSSIITNLRYNEIDAGSVASIKYIIDAYKKDIDLSLSIKDQIINQIPEMPSDPDLARKMVSYFFRKYNDNESILEKIPEYDFRKLTLAIIYGFDNYETIDSKYYALENLPEQLVMPVINKPLSDWGASGHSKNEILIKLSGFDLNMGINHPLYKLFTDYMSKNPEVGHTFRFGNEYSLKFNEMLYYMRLLPPDKIDEYLGSNSLKRSSEKFASLGEYLQEIGTFSDYDVVCQDIEDNFNFDPRKNINFYLLYKADKVKAFRLFDLFLKRNFKLEDVNFSLVDPNKFMDYALSNPDIISYFLRPEEFSLAYVDLGDKIFDFPPSILESICEYLTKTFSYDDENKYSKFLSILKTNPNFNKLSYSEQSDALSFYRLHDAYTIIPYDKVMNFAKFSKIDDRSIAANHLLLFGEYTPEWAEKTPRVIGSYASPEIIRNLGNEIKKDKFILAPIQNVVSIYDHQLLSEEDRRRPANEIALISNYGMTKLDIENKLKILDEAKKSMERAALKSPAYADLVPGSRDYYYMLHYIMNDYSIRGQNPNLFLKLRDYHIKSKVLYSVGLTQNKDFNTMTATIIRELGYEPTTANYLKVKNFVEYIVKKSYRKPWRNEHVVFIAKLLLNKHNDIQTAIDSDDLDDLLEKIYDKKELIPDDVNLVLSLNYKISLEHATKYDDTLGTDGNMSDANTKITKCVSIFGNLLPQALNQFAKVLCKSSYGKNIKDIDSLDPEEFESVLSRFTQNLPRKNQNYSGYAQYFQSRFTKVTDLGVLRKIGDNWNAQVKLFNDKNQLVGIETVKNIARNYSMYDLNSIIKITTASEILEDFEDCNKTFLRAYSNFDSCFGDDVTDMFSSTIKAQYPQREKIYLDGLNVPLPSWANYRNSIEKEDSKEKVVLRFLPRDDARGMYLGVMASCCQHLDGQAGTCAVDGHVNPKAAFMVFEINKEIIAEAYTWEDNSGNICLDSIETVGESAYHSEKTKEAIKQLLIDFGKSQNDCMVTVGNNKFGFESSPIILSNPTEHYKDYISTLSYKEFYRDDHEAQFLISDTRNVPYDQRTYDQDNPPQYSGNQCPMCGEMSLVDGECRRCDYDESDYSECPGCGFNTLDGDGDCQSRDCEFSFDQCPICDENELNPNTGKCHNCKYDYNNTSECPKCGEDSLLDGECLKDDCNYYADDYERCPECNEDSYDKDNEECFKCGYQPENDDEDDEDGDIVF
jgi:hypothetical protein